MQADVASHTGRLNELEQRVSSLKDENNSLSMKFLSLESKMAQLGEKMEDLENRSQRNNLRLVSLPEIITARDLHPLCETELLGRNHHCRVERAHRLGQATSHNVSPSNRKKRPPRQVIMHFLDYNDKNRPT